LHNEKEDLLRHLVAINKPIEKFNIITNSQILLLVVFKEKNWSVRILISGLMTNYQIIKFQAFGEKTDKYGKIL
jgi:hypothetical protein